MSLRFSTFRLLGSGFTSSPAQNAYRALEAADAFPDFDTWDRICKLYGWPRTFVGAGVPIRH
jgi:hypothetical protein